MGRPANPLSNVIPDYNAIVDTVDESKVVAVEEEKISEYIAMPVPEDKRAEPFPVKEFFRMEMFEVRELDEQTKKMNVRVENREVYAPMNPRYLNNHTIKCRVRCARWFDVSFEHMEEAYRVLNGKKVDSLPISAIIDRFGWSNGEQMNRADLGKKYGISVYAVQLAQEKLKTIIQRKDLATAYIEYVREFEREKAVDVIRDQTGV